MIAVPVPVPPPAAPSGLRQEQEGGETEEPRHIPSAPAAPQTAETAPRPDIALQVNIRMPEAATVPPEPAQMKQPQTLPSMPEVVVTPVAAPAGVVQSATPASAAPASTRPAPETSSAPPATPAEPVAREATAAQPLKSMTLEFAPDGAGDVRLRVSERAGEVHISLHSSDASLGGRLHEGVQDLVGSLSKAGYEAEAWTPGQGHNGNQRRQEERNHPDARPDDPDAEEFGGVFAQQNVQEVL
jgi:hypothetical protein